MKTKEYFIVRKNGNDYLCRKSGNSYCDVSCPITEFIEGEDEFEIIAPDPQYLNKIYKYRGRKVKVAPTFYENGWPAIALTDPKDDYNYDIITVNLETMPAMAIPNRAFIDCNNHPHGLQFLTSTGLANNTGYRRHNGFVSYPMVTLNLALLYQHDPDAFKDAND